LAKSDPDPDRTFLTRKSERNWQFFSWPGLKGRIWIRNDLKSNILIRAKSFRIYCDHRPLTEGENRNKKYRQRCPVSCLHTEHTVGIYLEFQFQLNNVPPAFQTYCTRYSTVCPNTRGGQNEDRLPSTSISIFDTTCRRHRLP